MSFGEIRLVNNADFGDINEHALLAADLIIKEGNGRARATYAGYGQFNRFVWMYMDTFFDLEKGHYTVAHEFAHHVLGVGDEYRDSDGIDLNAWCEAKPWDLQSTFSVMDNYQNRGTAQTGGPISLSEFCVASNHDLDWKNGQRPNPTDQSTRSEVRNYYFFENSVEGESCWETLNNHPVMNLPMPSGLPEDSPPASFLPPDFGVDPFVYFTAKAPKQFIAAIDISSSMNDVATEVLPSSESKLFYAKQALHTFVDQLAEDDWFGTGQFQSVLIHRVPADTNDRL